MLLASGSVKLIAADGTCALLVIVEAADVMLMVGCGAWAVLVVETVASVMFGVGEKASAVAVATALPRTSISAEVIVRVCAVAVTEVPGSEMLMDESVPTVIWCAFAVALADGSVKVTAKLLKLTAVELTVASKPLGATFTAVVVAEVVADVEPSVLDDVGVIEPAVLETDVPLTWEFASTVRLWADAVVEAAGRMIVAAVVSVSGCAEAVTDAAVTDQVTVGLIVPAAVVAMALVRLTDTVTAAVCAEAVADVPVSAMLTVGDAETAEVVAVADPSANVSAGMSD